MINFRKLKQDLSSGALKEGQTLFQGGHVSCVQIDSLNAELVSLSCSVSGNFDNPYSCKVEIDRSDSTLMDSECNCPYGTDCQHLAAVLFHLEKHFEDILIEFSQGGSAKKLEKLESSEKKEILAAVREAKEKKEKQIEKKVAEELVKEYSVCAEVLACSPFFIPDERTEEDRAELICVIMPHKPKDTHIKMRLGLRVPFRAKPLQVSDIRAFLDGVRYREPLFLSNKRFCFAMSSFSAEDAQILKMIMDFARPETGEDAALFSLETESLGSILAHAYDLATKTSLSVFGASRQEQEFLELSCFCLEEFGQPLKLSNYTAQLHFELEFLKLPAPKLFMKPEVVIGDSAPISMDKLLLLECQKPGLLYEGTYYRFQPRIKRQHLKHIAPLEHMAIPEPLLGTFVENALPELKKVAKVGRLEVIDQFVTMPFTGELKAACDMQYLDGELEASLHFIYDGVKVPAAHGTIQASDVLSFVTDEGIIARSLTEEEALLRALFQGFSYDARTGMYSVKSDKKVVEFMTEIIPAYSDRITFNCPKNLMGRFVFDETTFVLDLSEGDKVGSYLAKLTVKGHLKGLTVDHLWDCIATKRPYVELKTKKAKDVVHKILVLDLEKIAPIVQVFDELGLNLLDDHSEERPLWSLIGVDPEAYEKLPIKFKMSAKLKKLRSQMLGDIDIKPSPIPKEVQAKLRDYQLEGVAWLEKLRKMHLAGILADDMGLGKTLQAISALTQYKQEADPSPSLVVCPTSLVYNWKAEVAKFNPKLKTLVVDGTPAQRKKLIEKVSEHDVVVTSYTLLQKDIESYEKTNFGYAILDEAQHIKNRGTRNAKSVKRLNARHRLILTGTPIENSLEELWSLFDYLMPGLLSTYERFNEKYIRSCLYGLDSDLDGLRKKVAPFILRRMKSDVLQELPPVSHIVYKCHLSDLQKDLYRSYAESARKELSELVEREGFNKVQIQILATLTRLKQICCHPAIFAKEKAESGDSAKYEMMLELLESLMESKRKTVIFSQYTRMLNIMRQDFEKRGIRFCYLDGGSKDRLSIVNQFNDDPEILVFLVSLKAGGTGLNLTGADSVIHYDPWWNPAAEDQATDRVHRIGQMKNVSAYKLVTEETIEEKIQELQDRKRGLVKKVISSDEEALSKLSWDEVLELLKT